MVPALFRGIPPDSRAIHWHEETHGAAMKRLINLDPRGWWAFIIGAQVDYVEWLLAPEELKKAFDASRKN